VQVYIQEKKLEETLTDPSKIFNRDEMCFLMRSSTGRVLATKGQEMYSLPKKENKHKTLL
jgi:hypothetical protein